MARPQYIDKEKFKKHFESALKLCNIPNSKINKFLTESNTCRLRDIGICIAITDIIDDSIRLALPGYDGCISTDTFDKIYEWNKVKIYEYSKERSREQGTE